MMRLFGCMSLGFIARGYGLAASSSRLLRATPLALLADLVWYVFLVFFWGVIAGSEKLWLHLACNISAAVAHWDWKSQNGFIPTCVYSERRIMPCCTIFALPTSAFASRHAPCVPCWIAFIITRPVAMCLLIVIFIYNGMTAAWQHVVGAV